MRIAISGCGITGTAAAYFLAANGHEVVVFEQAPVCGPMGAGILLQPSGQVVLRKMGLLESLSEKSQRLTGMTALKRVGHRATENLIQLQYQWLDKDLYALGVHRGRLFQLLLDAAVQAGAEIVNNARVESIEKTKNSSGKQKIRVQTGILNQGETRGDFDFLIAADGSNSLLRKSCRLRTKVIEYDYAALWLTGHSDFQPDELFQVVDGTHRLVGLLPIGENECSFFWGLPASSYQSLIAGNLADWRDEAINLCPQSSSVLSRVVSWEQLTFARYRHVRINRMFTENVLFLGDAAHATSPHLGQGVNLGLEDAICFAAELEKHTDFSKSARAFARKRKRKVRYYQQLTRMLSPFFQSRGKWRGQIRDRFLPWFPRIPLVRRQMLRTLCGVKNGWLG